jgi:hypothetical protein
MSDAVSDAISDLVCKVNERGYMFRYEETRVDDVLVRCNGTSVIVTCKPLERSEIEALFPESVRDTIVKFEVLMETPRTRTWAISTTFKYSFSVFTAFDEMC